MTHRKRKKILVKSSWPPKTSQREYKELTKCLAFFAHKYFQSGQLISIYSLLTFAFSTISSLPGCVLILDDNMLTCFHNILGFAISGEKNDFFVSTILCSSKSRRMWANEILNFRRNLEMCWTKIWDLTIVLSGWATALFAPQMGPSDTRKVIIIAIDLTSSPPWPDLTTSCTSFTSWS